MLVIIKYCPSKIQARICPKTNHTISSTGKVKLGILIYIGHIFDSLLPTMPFLMEPKS
ncbi:protein of unknown function [Cupriavidus taiwanensis]|nr:protein of unknown function [Cupriavidus taiwanensis]